MATTDYAKHLESLKSQMSKQSLSVMVGAGFSKNCHRRLFPSWKTFSTDMIKEMFGHTIQYEYNSLQLAKTRGKKIATYKIMMDNNLDCTSTFKSLCGSCLSFGVRLKSKIFFANAVHSIIWITV